MEYKSFFTSRSNTPFFLIAGPCVIEDEGLTHRIAEKITKICEDLNIPLIFKASYRKANRSSGHSFTGIGDARGLKILQDVGSSYHIPVTTDIHSDDEASIAKNYVDIIQIPAFLCRQTSLLNAAAKTGLPVNIKKGQFASPEAMRFAVEKVRSSGNNQVMLTERGTSFGYQDLIVDYRGIPAMQKFDVPVIMDCTHALQVPNQTSGVTGGRPDMIETIAKAAVAVGIDGLFIETHLNPEEAKSDGANMLPLEALQPLLEKLLKIKTSLHH